MLNLLGLPVQASTHAAEIDHMISLVHWLMFVLFIGWAIFFAFVLFRFRRAANPKASYEGAHGKISKGIEVAIVVIDAFITVLFTVLCRRRVASGAELAVAQDPREAHTTLAPVTAGNPE